MKTHKYCQRTTGFTLVELLIVVSVISVLISLLLPALQSSREAARRCLCQNNLRQIAIALQNHEEQHKKFPIGARSQPHPSVPVSTYGQSWWVEILPQLEQQSLNIRLDKNGANNGMALLHAENGRLVDGVVISTMICPSTSLQVLWPVGGFQVMMPSYVGISGATSHDGFPENRVNLCCQTYDDGELSAGGLLISNAAIEGRRIIDGMSRTAIVAEASGHTLDKAGYEQRVDGGFPGGWILGTKAKGTPPEYSSPSLSSWNVTSVRYGINTPNYDLPGIHNNHGSNNPIVSTHPGGAQIAFADASVHFVSEETEINVLKRLATRDDSQLW